MDKNFKHIPTTPIYPGVDNINAYKYNNYWNYNTWIANTKLKLVSVNWDNEYNSCVYFETQEKRDAFFENLSGEYIELSTMFHVRNDSAITLPIPVDVLTKYNYLIAYSPIQAQDNINIEYENKTTRHNIYFYFITDVMQKAPNATDAILQLDIWQNFIYNTRFSNAILERGHWASEQTTASEFLNNPAEKSKYLLAPDIQPTNTHRVAVHDVYSLNSDVWAIIATSATTSSDFGDMNSQNIKLHTSTAAAKNGAPTFKYYGIDNTQLNAFLIALENNGSAWLWKAAIEGVFFVDKKFVNVGTSFSLCGHTLYTVTFKEQVTYNLPKLTVNNIGYDASINKWAKLYTYPYTYLIAQNTNGTQLEIKIEETNNNIIYKTQTNSVFPFINHVLNILGTSGYSKETTITFENMSNHTFMTDGRSLGMYFNFEVPIFAVLLSNTAAWWAQNYYNVASQNAQINTTYTNAQLSASNTLTNSNASSKTAYDSQSRILNMQLTNAQLTAAQNVTNQVTNNSYQAYDTWLQNELATAMQALNAGQARDTVAADNDAATQQAAVTTAANGVNSVMAGVTSGPVGIATGLLSAAVSGVGTGLTTLISNNLASSKVELQIGTAGVNGTAQQLIEQKTNANDRQQNRAEGSYAIAKANANLSNTLASTSNTVGKNNNTALYNTSNTISTNNYNTQINIAQNQRALSIKQRDYGILDGGTGAGLQVGALQGGNNSKPDAVQLQLVKLNNYDAFHITGIWEQYGYFCEMPVNITTFNIRNNFTYWKFSSITCTGNENANFNSIIKQILLTGTTIYSSNEKIEG